MIFDILLIIFWWIFNEFILFIGNFCNIFNKYSVLFDNIIVCIFLEVFCFEIVLLNLKL